MICRWFGLLRDMYRVDLYVPRSERPLQVVTQISTGISAMETPYSFRYPPCIFTLCLLGIHLELLLRVLSISFIIGCHILVSQTRDPASIISYTPAGAKGSLEEELETNQSIDKEPGSIVYTCLLKGCSDNTLRPSLGKKIKNLKI